MTVLTLLLRELQFQLCLHKAAGPAREHTALTASREQAAWIKAPGIPNKTNAAQV